MVMVVGGPGTTSGVGGILTTNVSGGSTGGLSMIGMSRHNRVVPGEKVSTNV